jgi:cytochrome b6-f complex iron-sulfur subunit
MAKDNPSRTPQEYEVLSGGGAEAAEMGRQGLTRRQVLRRAVLAGAGLVGAEAFALGMVFIYPELSGSFGGKVKLKKKTEYPAAMPLDYSIEDGKGVFYEAEAKSYISHMAAGIPWLLSGQNLENILNSEFIVKDTDGTYWLAIYQRCVHLGCKFNFKTDCRSFKCPCHGSHYNVNGEWLSGPAPRSNDRFIIDVSGDTVVVDTSKVQDKTQHPSPSTKLLEEVGIQFGCQ